MAVGVIRGTSGKTGRCGRTDTYGDSMTYGLWKIISESVTVSPRHALRLLRCHIVVSTFLSFCLADHFLLTFPKLVAVPYLEVAGQQV